MNELINQIKALLSNPSDVKVTTIEGNWFVPTMRFEISKGQYADRKENGITQYHTNLLNVNVPVSKLTAEIVASAMVHGFSAKRLVALKGHYKAQSNETVTLADDADFKLANAKVLLRGDAKPFHATSLGEEAIMLKFRVPAPLVGA